MLVRDARSRLQAANLRENRAWEEVKSREDWEAFRPPRLRALRESLGPPRAEPTAPPRVKVTRSLPGEGYRVENLVFESRPGLVVTANLYAPAVPKGPMPGLLISHSHHNPKTQGELQDMGMTWARRGCLVLIMDHLGHGERRQHPFASAADYPRPFKAGRQDYYFRYNTGVQLQLVGESLMGWMVWDLMRGLDLLLSRPGIDKDRIILLGAVAGGGDPAAVTAALDPRIKAVVPFNFGGPAARLTPSPPTPDRDFYYFGVADWESTRGLRLGARDGFAQWLIVGVRGPPTADLCPRVRLGPGRDPAWPRLRQVFGWYDASDRLAVVDRPRHAEGHAAGELPLQQHRPAPSRPDLPDPEAMVRHAGPRGVQPPAAGGRAALPDAGGGPGVPAAAVARAGGGGGGAAGPSERATAAGRAGRRAGDGNGSAGGWARLLGDVEPAADPKVLERLDESRRRRRDRRAHRPRGGAGRGRPHGAAATPPHGPGTRPPVVLGLAQEGKQAFLEHRSEADRGVARWRGGGLPDRREGDRRDEAAATARGGTTGRWPRSPRPSGCSARPSSVPGCATSVRSCATCGAAPTSTPAAWPSGATPSPRRGLGILDTSR